MREAAAPDANERDVQFIARPILTKERTALQDQQTRPGGGGGFEELTTIEGIHRRRR
jgi:hypothetical protein